MSEPTKIKKMQTAAQNRHGPITGVGHERYVAMVNCCDMLEQVTNEEPIAMIGRRERQVLLSETDMKLIEYVLDQLRETL